MVQSVHTPYLILLCYVIQEHGIYEGAVVGTNEDFSDEVLFLTDGSYIFFSASVVLQ